MNDLMWIAVIVVFIAALVSFYSRDKKQNKKSKRNYKYLPKDSIMTKSEMDFFWTLNKVVNDRYFIFPQVHLSALLDHKVVGQEWKYAFYHINAKSVDYVLCSKTTLQPLYAIELDDPSHDRVDRITRDIEVERIFNEASIPLVRFRDYKNLNAADIAQTLAHARKLSNDKSF
jgi:hypothetical protein